MKHEIWKPITDFEGFYEVSDFGRVKAVARTVKKKSKLGTPIEYYKKEKILKLIDNNGYKSVNLWKDGKMTTMYVHRLVATSFLKNPENKPQVNHIDGDGINNFIENLEWCTAKENIHHAFRPDRTISNKEPIQKIESINPEDVRRIFVEKIEKHGLNFLWLSKVTGISASSISKYFKSGRDIQSENFLKICEALNIKLFPDEVK